MPLKLMNCQRVFRINEPWFMRVGQLLLRAVEAEHYDYSLTLCNRPLMRKYHRRFWGTSKSTDVVAVRCHDDVTPDALPMDPHFPNIYDLGDIAMCVEHVDLHCKRHRLNPATHVSRLFTHSLVHLLGHDHQTDEEADAMEVVEDEIADFLRKHGEQWAHEEPWVRE